MKKMGSVRWGSLALALASVSIAGSAIAFIGGPQISTWWIGEAGDDWWTLEDCPPETYNFQEDAELNILEYAFNVDGMANDGDPNTYVRCQQRGHFQDLHCLAGLPDGTVVACTDDEATHTLPISGDTLYLNFSRNFVDPETPPTQKNAYSDCSIAVERSHGIANPLCRAGGDGDGDGDGGDGDGDGGFACGDRNSTELFDKDENGVVIVNHVDADGCYSFKSNGSTLRFGTWDGSSYTVESYDSQGSLLSTVVPQNGWTATTGTAAGLVYFRFTNVQNGAQMVQLQLGQWQ